MTAAELRTSFLDFFAEKEHSIVPSAPLLPSSPNLLFTNAGMNQFVPYFLGEQAAPYNPPRAADTQKCIRAGGKHNDLDDVGYDSYHHTLFEMLGNWSFGDYFKKEAIQWAWELLVECWGFPAERLYATVYSPDKEQGDPAEFDQEAYDYWKVLFEGAGLDPAVHIVNGNKQDNFWMMGDTGPCGPCSELHVDLTPKGDSKGSLVNMDDPLCIEIWNLVFIQFNAEADGSFRPLPATHVDTGMGFERVCSIIQCSKNFTDFSKPTSNYDTDVFASIFAAIAEKSGKSYTATMPAVDQRSGLADQDKIDVAFRVIADHLRALSFSIADGIQPGNNDRNYVLRRILRRAVRYGRELEFSGSEEFMAELVPTLVASFGEAFPELKEQESKIIETLRREEKQFNKTLDRGIQLFEAAQQKLGSEKQFPAATAFELYDTYGFPLDLTQLMLEEKGLSLDQAAVESLMEEQRDRARTAQQASKQVVAAVEIDSPVVSEFVGFDEASVTASVKEVHQQDGKTLLVVDRSPFYVEKGGQQGDVGTLKADGKEYPVEVSIGAAEALVLVLSDSVEINEGSEIELQIDAERRRGLEQHHSATHLLHWALHQIVGKEVAQQGSLVTPERLRFDCNSEPIDKEQLAKIEKLVSEKIAAADSISWQEVPYAEVKGKEEIMQFFGDKYGDSVRVVQIGGEAGALDGYSMELCGGTHLSNTSEIGEFIIKSEGAISAGVRRLEALCGEAAAHYLSEQLAEKRGENEELREKMAEMKLSAEVAPGSEGKTALLAFAQQNEQFKNQITEAFKKQQKAQGAQLASQADELVADWLEEATLVKELEGENPALLQEVLNALKKHSYSGAAFLVQSAGGKAHLGAYSGNTEQYQAGALISQLAPIVGGKGGGKPEMARGAGGEVDKIGDLLEQANSVLGA